MPVFSPAPSKPCSKTIVRMVLVAVVALPGSVARGDWLGRLGALAWYPELASQQVARGHGRPPCRSDLQYRLQPLVCYPAFASGQASPAIGRVSEHDVIEPLRLWIVPVILALFALIGGRTAVAQERVDLTTWPGVTPDITAVVAMRKGRSPAPIWLIRTNLGSISAANAAANIGAAPGASAADRLQHRIVHIQPSVANTTRDNTVLIAAPRRHDERGEVAIGASVSIKLEATHRNAVLRCGSSK